jgi:conjugal transfer pilus assembly protein TraV
MIILKRILAVTVLSQLLYSCTVYKKDFECPIPGGVKCKSVTEIEDSIIESERGPDLFSLDNGECVSCSGEKKKEESKETKFLKRVWVRGYTSELETQIEGHYVYFN